MSKENNTSNDNKGNGNLPIVTHRFNPKHTWEYNLLQQVRWNTEDAKEDVCFYIKNWLHKIVEEEGYTVI